MRKSTEIQSPVCKILNFSVFSRDLTPCDHALAISIYSRTYSHPKASLRPIKASTSQFPGVPWRVVVVSFPCFFISSCLMLLLPFPSQATTSSLPFRHCSASMGYLGPENPSNTRSIFIPPLVRLVVVSSCFVISRPLPLRFPFQATTTS